MFDLSFPCDCLAWVEPAPSGSLRIDTRRHGEGASIILGCFDPIAAARLVGLLAQAVVMPHRRLNAPSAILRCSGAATVYVDPFADHALTIQWAEPGQLEQNSVTLTGFDRATRDAFAEIVNGSEPVPGPCFREIMPREVHATAERPGGG